MMMRSPTQTKPTTKPSFTPVQTGLLQRKCACGNSASLTGKCSECENKRLTLQRRSKEQDEVSEVPPIVHEVLRSPGQPLDTDTRAFMESRFGHDLSQVRVHTDAKAAESAEAVNALAYTVGRDIAFASRRYAPETLDGKKLLAHELTHTIQQQSLLRLNQHSSPLEKGRNETSQLDEAFEREADLIADRVIGIESPAPTPLSLSVGAVSSIMLQRSPNGTSPRPTIPTRGSNPAACILPLCAQSSGPPVPTNDAEAQQRGNQWLSQALNCVTSGASASNASHANQIVANEESELQAEVNQLNQNLASQPRRGGRYRDYLNSVEQLCRRKQREISIEFNYNVIFENPPGRLQWGFYPAEWNNIEGALAELPAEATWANPQLLRFRREACHPDDVSPTTGACVGQSTGQGFSFGFTGGEAEVATGQIRVFNAGLRDQPYSRSTRLGLSATFQTIRHEVGHIVISQIPQSDKDELFENIMHWHDYSWDWITANPAPYSNWQAERDRLRTALGLNNTQLDAWLSRLVVNVPVVEGSRTYTKRSHTRAGTSFFLQSFETLQIPTDREFEYARTSREEYLAELYALAVSRPEFLHSVLPANQIVWLKRTIFHTPENLRALARQTALSQPAQTEFVIRGSRLFTWEQLDLLMNELIVQYRQPGTQLA